VNCGYASGLTRLDSEALSNQITMAGLEVDGVEPVSGAFNGVVVGEVVECGQHPNADKLRVTKVNVGGERLLDIVCGAPNCRQGLKVAVATVGAVLPGDFKIKAAKLRGEPSEGMLCSFSELGISDDHSGIIELPLDAPIGTDIREYLKLDDNTIEISVTPNRADCLGIIGVARDVAVLNKTAERAGNRAGCRDHHDVCRFRLTRGCVPALSGPRGERHQR
jgi:phenylalanyl-tRNA synthetase beta chain